MELYQEMLKANQLGLYLMMLSLISKQRVYNQSLSWSSCNLILCRPCFSASSIETVLLTQWMNEVAASVPDDVGMFGTLASSTRTCDVYGMKHVCKWARVILRTYILKQRKLIIHSRFHSHFALMKVCTSYSWAHHRPHLLGSFELLI